jgi:hypothetical protein
MAQSSFGSLILSSTTFSDGTGLGNEPTILTIHGNGGTEIGCVGATSSNTGTGYNATGVCQSGTNDTQTGSSQIGPVALSAAGSTVSASNFGIVFNASEPGGSGITLTGLTAAFYTSTGVFLYETSGLSCLAALGTTACAFTNTDTGAGKSGYVFVLDAAQQTAANAAHVFDNQSNIVALSASATNAEGGNETFYLATTSGTGTPGPTAFSPEPTTWVLTLAGVGLVALGSVRRRSARHN